MPSVGVSVAGHCRLGVPALRRDDLKISSCNQNATLSELQTPPLVKAEPDEVG